MNELINLYKTVCGTEPATIEALPGAGSNRKYFRLTGELRTTACRGGACPRPQVDATGDVQPVGMGPRPYPTTATPNPTNPVGATLVVARNDSPLACARQSNPVGAGRVPARSVATTLIGVQGTSVEENKAFIYMSRHFEQKGLPVPHVHAVSDDWTHYLQDDLGDMSLFKAIENGRLTGRFNDEEKALLRKTIRLLPRLQFEGAMGMDFSVCHPQPEFNRRSVLWDLNYFKYCFLKATGVEFQENLLEDDFERLAEDLLCYESKTFMYRDFQSRNVMIRDGEPYFIDFQGGRKGPIFYDVASFLWQAKANMPQSLRDELISEYLDALRPYSDMTEVEFRGQLRLFVLFRTLQVLGAYGFRGYFERKQHFLESIPFALENLRGILRAINVGADRVSARSVANTDELYNYPYLTLILQQMCNGGQVRELPLQGEHGGRTSVGMGPRPNPTTVTPKRTNPVGATLVVARNSARQLLVRIISFSYKKGIPDDPTGNGGGYVFDCRAIHNPGKYEQYKKLTGRDQPVIKFLEDDGEITRFLEHVYALADAHVERYLERGFTSLMLCFGCTGGQHRSVYSAEHVARHIQEKYGVKVEIIHREQTKN